MSLTLPVDRTYPYHQPTSLVSVIGKILISLLAVLTDLPALSSMSLTLPVDLTYPYHQPTSPPLVSVIGTILISLLAVLTDLPALQCLLLFL